MSPENEPIAAIDTDSEPDQPAAQKRGLTRRERRNRWILLAVLLLLLMLLSYATYYFVKNRSLPSVRIAAPAEVVEPPQYLYSITGEGTNELDRPIGVAVGPDGRVYAVDFGKRRVSVFTNAGEFLFSFKQASKGNMRNPVHMAIYGDELWLTDRRLRSILIYDLEGKFKRYFEPKGEELNWTPLALAFDRAGAPRVTDVGKTTDHQLLYFSKDGSRTASVGQTMQVTRADEEPGGFFFPNGVAVAKDGRVFVSDGDNRRVQVFDDGAEFQYFVDTSGLPRGIAIDEEERLYVVDALAHTVDIYDLEGEKITSFGSQGFGPGQFNYPNDIAVDNNGRIYITDRENDQVQVWGWPVAQPPAVAVPSTAWGWALCLSPLLLLLLPFLLRRTRIVVSPEFVDELVAAGAVRDVANARRLRLICPMGDHARYQDRVIEGVDLGELIAAEEHSDADARALREKLDIDERDAVIISMAARVKGLGTEDADLRRLALLAEVRTYNLQQFFEEILRRARKS